MSHEGDVVERERNGMPGRRRKRAEAQGARGREEKQRPALRRGYVEQRHRQEGCQPIPQRSHPAAASHPKEPTSPRAQTIACAVSLSVAAGGSGLASILAAGSLVLAPAPTRLGGGSDTAVAADPPRLTTTPSALPVLVPTRPTTSRAPGPAEATAPGATKRIPVMAGGGGAAGGRVAAASPASGLASLWSGETERDKAPVVAAEEERVEAGDVASAAGTAAAAAEPPSGGEEEEEEIVVVVVAEGVVAGDVDTSALVPLTAAGGGPTAVEEAAVAADEEVEDPRAPPTSTPRWRACCELAGGPPRATSGACAWLEARGVPDPRPCAPVLPWRDTVPLADAELEAAGAGAKAGAVFPRARAADVGRS